MGGGRSNMFGRGVSDGQIDEEEFCKMIFRHSGAPKASKKPPASKLTDQEQIEILGTYFHG